MKTDELLQSLDKLGICLRRDGDRLICDAPQGAVTEQLARSIREHKQALLERLESQDVGSENEASQAEVTDHPPLSFPQQALWLIHQLEPNNPAYNTPAVYRVDGRLDRSVLRQCFREVLRRHDILRTVFRVKDGRPVQCIESSLDPAMTGLDLGQGPGPTSSQELEHFCRQEIARPFDLTEGPLLRIRLMAMGPQEHILLLVAHHTVIDMWSLNLLMNEVSALYQAFRNGKPSPLAEPVMQYADYAVRQRQELSGAESRRQLEYWRDRLQGDVPVLHLPSSFSRPPVRSWNGDSFPVEIPETLTGALIGLARSEGATLFMVLMSAWQALLFRYSGQEDFCLGWPMMKRPMPEAEQLIGMCLNTMVLRTPIHPGGSFREALQRVKQDCLEAYTNSDIPFEMIVKELKLQRDLSITPLYQVMLAFQSGMRKRFAAGEVTFERIEAPSPGAQTDVRLVLTEDEGRIDGFMEFSTDVFEKPFVQTMWRSYLALLEGAAANPDETVARLPVVTAAERQRIMVDWNQTGKPYDDQRCVHELFEAQVERTPEAPALVCGLETLSYRALNRRANQLAWRLKRLGIGPETMVGLFMERSSEMVLGIYGIIKAGGAYVPIDPEFPAERLQFLLQDTQVPVVLTQQHLRSALPDHPGTTICLDVEGSSLKAESAENLDSGVRTDNLCYVIYTSGSTGKPKGVMNEHRGIVNRLVWMQDEYCLTGTDRVLQKTPFSFDVSVWEFFWPLLVGATLVVAPPGSHKDPSELIEQIVSQNISTIHFVPSMLGVFLKDRRVEACSCLKRVFCSGEALPYEFQEEFFARLPSTELHNLYGPTEAAVDVSYWPCRPRSDKRIVPIGKPVANTQLYVLDSLLQPVPAGVAGELHIGGVQVARGYWNRPELTRDKFIPDPFSGQDGARLYKTGDLVRHLEDGNIEYLGRNDFQVKIRGQRIELGEIEAALMTHPQVAEALVTAEDAGSGDKRLIAYTVAKAGAELSVKDLRDHLKAILPESLIPGTVMQLESFPLLANGKINRRALPVAKRERGEAGAEYSAPQNDLESGVAAIWQEVLGIEEVGVNDNFFDIGGHSLLLVSVLRLLHERYDGGLRIMNLFEYPTIRSLAEYLGKKRLTASRVTRAAERAGRKKARLSGPQPRLRDMEP